MLSEGVSRISIIKHALDHILKYGDAPITSLTFRIGNKSYKIIKKNLPPKFINGLKILYSHPYTNRLPYLFQTFLELYGGFIFLDSEEDLGPLEALSGIPRAHILEALYLLDHFFSSSGKSMFYKMKERLLCFKMVPGFVRGIGSFFRYRYLGFDDYDKKYPDFGWLLKKWHSAGYNTLKKELLIIDS